MLKFITQIGKEMFSGIVSASSELKFFYDQQNKIKCVLSRINKIRVQADQYYVGTFKKDNAGWTTVKRSNTMAQCECPRKRGIHDSLHATKNAISDLDQVVCCTPSAVGFYEIKNLCAIFSQIIFAFIFFFCLVMPLVRCSSFTSRKDANFSNA